MPGLFDTTHFDWQLTGFFAIFVLEGAATYYAYQQGVVITAILASIFVDVLLAILAHVFQKDICRLKNERVYEQGVVAAGIGRRLSHAEWKQRAFYLLILISAMFKFVWFYTAYTVFNAMAVFVLTCYLIGALLHTTCTGYALFTAIFRWKMKREHDQHVDSGGKRYAFDPKTPRPSAPLGGPDSILHVTVGNHEVALRDGEFYLLTYGVLTDAELREMIAHQELPAQKRTLAVEGVRQQMVILQVGGEVRDERIPHRRVPTSMPRAVSALASRAGADAPPPKTERSQE